MRRGRERSVICKGFKLLIVFLISAPSKVYNSPENPHSNDISLKRNDISRERERNQRLHKSATFPTDSFEEATAEFIIYRIY